MTIVAVFVLHHVNFADCQSFYESMFEAIYGLSLLQYSDTIGRDCGPVKLKPNLMIVTIKRELVTF